MPTYVELNAARRGGRPGLDDLTNLVRLSETVDTSDPDAVHRRLREQYGEIAPVLLDDGVPAWLLLGHSEICSVARNDALFSRDANDWRHFTDGSVRPGTGLWAFLRPRDNAFYTDGERHRHFRRVLDDCFATVDETALARRVRVMCEALLDRIEPDGSADLLASYAAVVPVLAVAGMYEVDPGRAYQMEAYVASIFSVDATSAASFVALEELLGELVDERRARPGADLLTAYVQHRAGLSQSELVDTARLTIIAGYEMTIAWISSTLREILTDSSFAGRVSGGRTSVEDALDAVLWRDPPGGNLVPRFALEDCELAGQRVRKGDGIVFSIGAANRDPRVHSDDPWDQVGNRAYLTFGVGPHTCPAPRLSRIIVKIAVEAALRRLVGLRLAVPPAEIGRRPSIWSRYPDRLPVTFTQPPGPEQ